MSSVLKLPTGTKPSPAETALAELHTKRRELVAAKADLRDKSAKVAAAPKETSQVRAEIAALTAKEHAAAALWADAGASGAPPAVDIEARAELAKRLAAAEAQTAAAEAAIAALKAKDSDLDRQLEALNIAIATAATDVLFDLLNAQVEEGKALIEKLLPIVGSIDSLRNVIVIEARQISDRSGGQRSIDLYRRLELVPTSDSILRVGPPSDRYGEWLRRLEALKSGGEP